MGAVGKARVVALAIWRRIAVTAFSQMAEECVKPNRQTANSQHSL